MTMHELINDPSTLLVDCRSEGEFAMGNVRGSVNIPLHDIPTRLDEFKNKEGNIAIFCMSGARAGQAEMYLKQNGVDNVVNIGGWAQVKIHRMASA